MGCHISAFFFFLKKKNLFKTSFSLFFSRLLTLLPSDTSSILMSEDLKNKQMSFVCFKNDSHRFFCYLLIDIMIIFFFLFCGAVLVFLFSFKCPFSFSSVYVPSLVTLCHLLAKLGAKPGCKSCPTGLECRGSRGPWLNWHMHHRVWGMTPWCQTQDPSNITNLTKRRKLVMGDATSIWNPEKDFFSHFVPDVTQCGTCHIDGRLFLIIAATPQRFF